MTKSTKYEQETAPVGYEAEQRMEHDLLKDARLEPYPVEFENKSAFPVFITI